MPGKVMKIGSFSDWVGLFATGAGDWRQSGDVPRSSLNTLYGAVETATFSSVPTRAAQVGEPAAVPNQQMRDALMNMIVYQGDTNLRAWSSSATS